jgi:hypothetical protein
MTKMYSTAKGVQIDIDAFTSKHEKTRAVGNMNVNARGDLLDSKNKNIQSKNKQVGSQYRKQIGNMVTDEPVYASKRAAKRAQNIAEEYSVPNTVVETPREIEGLDKPLNPEMKVALEVSEQQAKAYEPGLPPKAAEEKKVTKVEVIEDGSEPKSGLAAAIAKARQSKQEPLKTPRQEQRETSGVKRV